MGDQITTLGSTNIEVESAPNNISKQQTTCSGRLRAPLKKEVGDCQSVERLERRTVIKAAKILIARRPGAERGVAPLCEGVRT